MIKILHTADAHLDPPLKSLALLNESLSKKISCATRKAIAQIVNTAIDESVVALLIAGDLYDGTQRSKRTAAFLIEQFERLKSVNIPVF